MRHISGCAVVFVAACVTCATAARTSGRIIATTPSIPATPTRPPAPSPRRPPAAVEGPLALVPLFGLCFATEIRNYQYEFCPFANATQRDVASTYNPFYGLLGIFEGWEYQGQGPAKRFYRQRYTDGTDCGSKKRSLIVTFACAATGVHSLTDIREPATCEYVMTFMAPEACGADFLVSNGVFTIAGSPAPEPSTAASSVPVQSSTAAGTPSPSTSRAASATGARSTPPPPPASSSPLAPAAASTHAPTHSQSGNAANTDAATAMDATATQSQSSTVSLLPSGDALDGLDTSNVRVRDHLVRVRRTAIDLAARIDELLQMGQENSRDVASTAGTQGAAASKAATASTAANRADAKAAA